jgi:hypothetical protein
LLIFDCGLLISKPTASPIAFFSQPSAIINH